MCFFLVFDPRFFDFFLAINLLRGFLPLFVVAESKIAATALSAVFSHGSEELRNSTVVHTSSLRGWRSGLCFWLCVLQCLCVVTSHEEASDAFIALYALFEAANAQTQVRTRPSTPIDYYLSQ
jgi:hypothetical protein